MMQQQNLLSLRQMSRILPLPLKKHLKNIEVAAWKRFEKLCIITKELFRYILNYFLWICSPNFTPSRNLEVFVLSSLIIGVNTA